MDLRYVYMTLFPMSKNTLNKREYQLQTTGDLGGRMQKVLLWLLVTLTFKSAAQDSESRIEQLMAMGLGELIKIEVATGTSQALAEAPAVVSVITQHDIKATGARTLAEAMERIPGLHVAASQFRLQKMFSVRGIQSDFTPQILVLMDGIEINQITSTSTPVSFHYPVHAIQRIEVIRGPGSAVYGADAFSGVINVITKKSKDIVDNQVGATAGSFDSTEVWFNGKTSLQDIDFSLLVDYETTQGDDGRVTQYGNMKTDRDVQNIHLNAEGRDWSLTNWYYRVERYQGNGVSIFANDVDFDKTEVWKSKFDYSYAVNDALSMVFDVSLFKNEVQSDFKLFPEGTWPVGADGNLLAPPFLAVEFPNGVIGNPGADMTRYKANITSIYQASDNHRLRIAMGYSSTKVKTNESKNFGPGVLDGDNFKPVSTELVDVTGTVFNFLQTYDRDLRYLSVQDEWTINQTLAFTGGVRFDHYSDFGSTTNPRLAFVWKASDVLTTKILYGSAFRVATASERSIQNNPANLGNPNIKPENISTSEIVFDYRPNEYFDATLNLYQYQAKDLIVLDDTFTYQNIGKQDGKGAELELNWRYSSKLSLNTTFSYQDSEDPVTGTKKALVPEFMASADIRYSVTSELQVGLQSYWINNRQREQGDFRQNIDDYVKTDLNIIYSISSSWAAQLQVKNVFDEDIREPSPNSALFSLSGLGALLGIELPDLGFPNDYPMEGRAIYASVTHTF